MFCFKTNIFLVLEKLTSIDINNYTKIKNLLKIGIIKIGTYVNSYDYLVGKIKKIAKFSNFIKLLDLVFSRSKFQNTSFRLSPLERGKILEVKVIRLKLIYILIYLKQNRKISIGDKVSGRHGNKGVVSKILSDDKMPFLQNGKKVEIILNPLGIPSRMNLGQVFECLLGLAGHELKECYRLTPFDETFAIDVSSVIIYNKLKNASEKKGLNFLFNPNFLGKMKIFSGTSSKSYINPVTIGYSYFFKLVHIARDKLTSRFVGSYSYITKQPLKGKGKKGGQRMGEMEIWALEGYGSSYILQEIITLKSDDLTNKANLLLSLFLKRNLPHPKFNESFKVFILELQSICFNVSFLKQTTFNLF